MREILRRRGSGLRVLQQSPLAPRLIQPSASPESVTEVGRLPDFAAGPLNIEIAARGDCLARDSDWPVEAVALPATIDRLIPPATPTPSRRCSSCRPKTWDFARHRGHSDQPQRTRQTRATPTRPAGWSSVKDALAAMTQSRMFKRARALPRSGRSFTSILRPVPGISMHPLNGRPWWLATVRLT